MKKKLEIPNNIMRVITMASEGMSIRIITKLYDLQGITSRNIPTKDAIIVITYIVIVLVFLLCFLRGYRTQNKAKTPVQCLRGFASKILRSSCI